MAKYLCFYVLSFLLLQSCNESPTDPRTSEPFSLDIKVIDPAGNPVQGINVSIWSKLNYNARIEKNVPGYIIASATNIQYSVMEPSFVKLVIYESDNSFKQELLSKHHEPGNYSAQFGINETGGTKLFKLIMTAAPDSLSATMIFKDSIYLVLLQPDPAVSIVGTTGNNGIISTFTKEIFPHFYNITSIPFTNEMGPEILGAINISDSVNICLTNESFSQRMDYDRRIIDGKNSFTFIWNPTGTEGNTSGGSILPIQKISKNATILESSSEKFNEKNLFLNFEMSFNYPAAIKKNAQEWKLFQNYPNPFN